MSAMLPTMLFTRLLWCVLLSAVYTGLLFAVDALLVAYRCWRQERQNLRCELARLDREAAASVQRIGAAFALAQRLLREEALQAGHR